MDDKTKRSGLMLDGSLNRRDFLVGTSLATASLLVSANLKSGLAADGPLKIGCLGPFTGPAARTGDAMKEGTMLAIEDARAANEIPVTIDGQKRDVEIVWIDDQSSPEVAVKALNSAINRDGVQMIINGWHSSVALAVMDAELPYNIVNLGSLAASQSIADKILAEPEKYRGYFKGWPSAKAEAGIYAEPLQQFLDKGMWKPANRKAAVVAEDTDYGSSWGQSMVESLQRIGFEVVAFDKVALEQTEFAPFVLKYQAAKVSAVGMTISASAGASNLVKQIRSQGLKALVLGHGLTWFNDWAELTGQSSDYVLSMDSPIPIAPWQKDWMARFQEKYGHEANLTPSGLPYDYTRMAIQVLNQAGTLDFDALTKTIKAASYKGIWNLYKFADGPGEKATAPNEILTGSFMEGLFYPMVQLMNGQKKVVYPFEYAEAEFVPPPGI